MIRINLFIPLVCVYIAASSSCSFKDNGSSDVIEIDSTSLPPVAEIKQGRKDTVSIPPVPLDPAVADKSIQLGKNVSPDQLLAYAKTLIGTPYKYASIDPAVGLDCSGFITHVFNHFSIQVPRSSIDFTNYGVTVNVAEAIPGDLILFRGTDSLSQVVGHMGIVIDVNEPVLKFIHSTSGKAYGVTITELNASYKKRFVKVIRIPYITTMF